MNTPPSDFFQDKIALITGASRGIGAAVARTFAQRGAHVILLARTQGALEEVYDQITDAGGAATIIRMDLNRLDKINALGPTIFEKFGKLDICVGNAGDLGKLMPAHQMDTKTFERMMNLNFHANVRLIKTLDPLLRNAPQGKMMFTTHSDLEPRPYWGGYLTSKQALETYVTTYAAEISNISNLDVAMIKIPANIDTKLFAEAYPGGTNTDVLRPEDTVNHFVDFCIESR